MIFSKCFPFNFGLFCRCIRLEKLVDVGFRAVEPFKEFGVLFLEFLKVTQVEIDGPLLVQAIFDVRLVPIVLVIFV